MNIGSLFNIVLINPIVNVLLAIYHVLVFVHVPYALGFAIIGLTVVIRFALYPFIHAQLKTSKKMQDIAPHISNLKNKHKGDNKKIQEETAKLYKEHGVNPLAGCLPLLVQLPLIWALYGVLQRIVTHKPAEVMSYVNHIVYVDSLKITTMWDPTFFGIPLGKHPGDLMNSMPAIILVPVLTGVLQFIQTKMMSPALSTQKTIVKKGEADSQDDFAKAFQSQSLYIFPIMIAYFSYSFPIGLSLYWNTFSVFGILQQHKISGLGALGDLKKKFLP